MAPRAWVPAPRELVNRRRNGVIVADPVATVLLPRTWLTSYRRDAEVQTLPLQKACGWSLLTDSALGGFGSQATTGRGAGPQ